MLKNTPSKVLGLDIGQSAVKAVVLARRGGDVRVVDQAVFDFQAEGVLDESELWDQLEGWLAQCRFDGLETVVGIPQYFATTQVNDFPVGEGEDLERMVEYETQHLAGLSDESFIHHFVAMPESGDKRNPALIGVCRAAVVEERCSALTENGVHVTDVGLTGTAFASACLALTPPKHEKNLTLALDVGTENATVAILRGRTALHISSIPEGLGGGYTREKAADQVCSETALALEQWREQESASSQSSTPDRILLAGGGARESLIKEALSAHFKCPVSVVGIAPESGGHSDPRLVTAYGLALQGLRRAAFPLSMMTADAQSALRRRRRFKYIVLAAILLSGLIAYCEATLFWGLEQRAGWVQDALVNIEQCHRYVPDLDSLSIQRQMLRRTVLPVAAKAASGPRYLETVQALVDACGNLGRPANDQKVPNAWVVYLADTATFDLHSQELPEVAALPRHRRPGRGPAVPPIMPGTGGSALPEASSEWYQLRSAQEVAPVAGMVAGILAQTPDSEPFMYVSRLIRMLEALPDFQRVDLLAQQEQTGLGKVFEPWTRALLMNRIRNVRGFMIKIPFASSRGRAAQPEG